MCVYAQINNVQLLLTLDFNKNFWTCHFYCRILNSDLMHLQGWRELDDDNRQSRQ